jgi:hypothetical protein
VGAILTALLAWRRGRSPIGWGVAGLILPLFALIALALLPSRRQVVNAPTQRQGWSKTAAGWSKPSAPSTAAKRCPQCAKVVKVDAQACPYCRFDFNQAR